MFYVVLFLDIAHSMRLVDRLGAFAGKPPLAVRLEDVRMRIHEAMERAGNTAGFLPAFLSPPDPQKEAGEAWKAKRPRRAGSRPEAE